MKTERVLSYLATNIIANANYGGAEIEVVRRSDGFEIIEWRDHSPTIIGTEVTAKAAVDKLGAMIA